MRNDVVGAVTLTLMMNDERAANQRKVAGIRRVKTKTEVSARDTRHARDHGQDHPASPGMRRHPL